MIEFELTEDQLTVQDMARKFAEREIRPIAERLDRSQHLLEDFPWTLVQKGSEVGLRTVALPNEYDGPDFDYRNWVVLIDELGYPDLACAKIFSHNWRLCRTLVCRGTQEQKDRFLPVFRDDHRFLLAGDGAEPVSGFDSRLSSRDPHAGATLRARRVGDHYVMNGKKSCIGFGPQAKLLLVNARTGKSENPAEGTSTFLVPGDTPGVRLAAIHDKLGMRMHLQGQMDFDNVTITADNLLGGKEGHSGDEAEFGAGSLEISAHAMTLARAALDATTKYATERIQGGKRIIEHQAVAIELAEMYIALQAGRSLLWQVAWSMDNNQVDQALNAACKVFCTEAAVKICRDAVELFGGSGVMRELPLQKYFRDSLVLLHMEGTNQSNRVKVGEILDSRAGYRLQPP